MLLHFNLTTKQLEQLKEFGIKDLTDQGHWGSLKSRFRVSNEEEYDKALQLLEISYKNVILD